MNTVQAQGSIDKKNASESKERRRYIVKKESTHSKNTSPRMIEVEVDVNVYNKVFDYLNKHGEIDRTRLKDVASRIGTTRVEEVKNAVDTILNSGFADRKIVNKKNNKTISVNETIEILKKNRRGVGTIAKLNGSGKAQFRRPSI
ncbi:hypothetical protein E9993_13690 [Labilibacter sediminis]|nr:hypothetical protein E9993_13690 [Labilibacter sediminis]